APHTEMTAGVGHPLRMVASIRTDEMCLTWIGGAGLAHRREGAAQLVAAHRGQILAFQPDLCAVAGGEMLVSLQRRRGEDFAQRLGRCARTLSEFAHAALRSQIEPLRRGAKVSGQSPPPR